MDVANFAFVLHDISRFMRADFAARAAHLKMTQAQLRTLAHLSRMQGCSQRELAERLEVRPITLARQIDQLERGKWIERRADPADRRAFRLFLTARAEPRIAAVRSIGRDVQQRALRGLTRVQRAEVLRLLSIVRDTQLSDRGGVKPVDKVLDDAA